MRERPFPFRRVGWTTKVFSYPRLSLVNRSCGRTYFLFCAVAGFFAGAFARARVFAVFLALAAVFFAAAGFLTAGFSAFSDCADFLVSAGVAL